MFKRISLKNLLVIATVLLAVQYSIGPTAWAGSIVGWADNEYGQSMPPSANDVVDVAEISTTVYWDDGNTPWDGEDIMVGTKLAIIVNSNVPEWLYGGSLAIADANRDYGVLSARGTEPIYLDSCLPAAGTSAFVSTWLETGIAGFDMYVGGNDVNVGDWFIIDYTASTVGTCMVGFYDHDVSWVDPVYYLEFTHINTPVSIYDVNIDPAVPTSLDAITVYAAGGLAYFDTTLERTELSIGHQSVRLDLFFGEGHLTPGDDWSHSQEIGALAPDTYDLTVRAFDPIFGLNDTYTTSFTVVPELLEAGIEIYPKTFNLRSKGKWIMCVIRLPEDYNVTDIEPNSILLEDEIEADRVWLGDEFAVAKFSRREVQEMLGEVETPDEVELVVSGELSDGTIFEGTDTIRVIDKGKGRNNPPGKAVKRAILKRK